jgi:hypothetical protein
MAEATFDTVHQQEQVRKQVKTAVEAYRQMLETFVNSPMRRAASEAEHGRQRPLQSAPVQPDNSQ